MTDPQPGNQPAGGAPPYVSPEQAVQQQLVAAGYDPNSKGFWDAFQNIMAKAQGTEAAQQQRSQETRQLGQDVEYRSGLDPSSADYLGRDHQDLYNMVQPVEPGQVTGVSSSWTQLANAMATFGQDLSGAANSSGSSWKGGAADSAFNFVGGLGKWSDDSGAASQFAADQVYNQSSAAETAKNAMPEPIPFSWTDEMKSWADSNPLDLIKNIDNSFQKQQDSQNAHTEAAQVMSNYDNNLYGAAAKAPSFSPPPSFDNPSGNSVGSIGGAIVGNLGGAVQSAGGNVGASGGAKNNIDGNTGNVGSSTGSLGSVSGISGTGTASLQSGSKTGGVSTSNTSPGGTSAQAFAPGLSGNSGNSSGLDSAGLGAMGGMPMGGMGGFGDADGDEYSGKVGRGGSSGSFGPGGSGGSGSAAGSGSAGGQSGARAGGAGAAESAGGAGRGAASSGASGRGAMGAGAHGGKGQGEEDEEHNRPSWLVEADPDEVFGSSERTAPPVIGE